MTHCRSIQTELSPSESFKTENRSPEFAGFREAFGVQHVLVSP
jgi:hypothetical protein